MGPLLVIIGGMVVAYGGLVLMYILERHEDRKRAKRAVDRAFKN